MKIIFMGTPDYAQKILEALILNDKMEIVAVYTQPDKPVGRKKIITPPKVKLLAQNYKIKVFQPEKLREAKSVNNLLNIVCDYIVVAAYGQILPKAILDHAPCINLHASILPFYRGASPIQQVLLNNENKTGVTAMLMEEGLDTGDIIKIETIDVTETEMLEELFYKLTDLASKLTIDVLNNFRKYKQVKQDNTKATNCKKITKIDGLVLLDDAQITYNKYRAFTPWPGIYLENGLKLKRIEIVENNSKNNEGEILKINDNNIIIGCKKGSIKLFNVQPSSKKEMNVVSYINGKRLVVADRIS